MTKNTNMDSDVRDAQLRATREAVYLSDIHRLLEGLKPFGDAFVERERLAKKGTVEAIWTLVGVFDYKLAHQLRTELIERYGEK